MAEATVYNIEVDGQKRKAFDAIALKQFIEQKKFEYSVLSLDPDRIDKDELAVAYIAKAAVSTLKELEGAIDQVLGLTSPEEFSEHDTDDSEDLVEEVEEQVESTPVESPKDKVVEQKVEETEESEERIVL